MITLDQINISEKKNILLSIFSLKNSFLEPFRKKLKFDLPFEKIVCMSITAILGNKELQ